MNITWVGSPNFDSNRKQIKKIVIHWFGIGTLAGADATFQKAGGTSAHYAVSDNIVHQYVKEEHVAYHAGNYSVNQESIGIEHDANPDKPLSEDSYKTSAQLIAELCKKHNIPLDRQHIIKHSEVPRATSCCGTVDVDKLISLAKGTMPEETIDVLKSDFENLVKKSTAYDEFVNAGYDSVDDIYKITTNLNNDVESLKRNNVVLADKLKECQLAVESHICDKIPSAIKIDKEIQIAGVPMTLNGGTVDSNGVVTANYMIKK